MFFQSDRTRVVQVASMLFVISTATFAGEEPRAVVTQTSATVSALAPANAVTLAYKFHSGQFAHYMGTSRIQYKSQLDPEHIYITQQSNDTWTRFRVVTVDESGLALIEPVIERTRMMARMHDKPPVLFDSDAKTEPQPEFRAIRDAIGKSIARFQVAPNGKLVKAIVIDSNAPASLKAAALKLETRFPYLPILPSTPVAVGDKWREEFTVDAVNEGLKEPIPMRRIFELTGIAEGIAIIKFKTLTMKSISEPELDKQLIQQTPTGTIEFDIERGLVRSYTSNINKTVINALGNETLLQVVGESTEKLVTADGRDPAAAIAKPNYKLVIRTENDRNTTP